jgi:hypothetical protein
MATMNILGITYNVVYVDSTAVGANDGTTMANALTNIPTYDNFQSDTVYLFRRHDTTNISYPSDSIINAQNVFFIGMPLTTDSIYNSLPAEAKGTSWDSDLDTHAKIYITSGNYKIYFNDVNNFGAHRIKFSKNENSVTNGNLYINSASQEGTCFITNCEAITENHDFSDLAYTTFCDRQGFTFYINNKEEVIINDNKFMFSGDYDGWLGHHFIEIGNTITIKSNDNIFWASTAAFIGSYRIFHVKSDCNFTEFLNNEIKFYTQPNYDYKGFNGVDIQSDGIIARNFKVSIARNLKDQTLFNGNGGIRTLFSFHNNNSFQEYNQEPIIIENILIDFRGYNTYISTDNIININTNRSNTDTRYDYQSNSYETSIKNISAFVEPESTAGFTSSGKMMSIYAPGQSISNIHVEMESSTANCFAFQGFSIGKIEDIHIKGQTFFENIAYADIESISYENATEKTNIMEVRDSILNVKNMTLRSDWSGSNWLYNNTVNNISSYGNGSKIMFGNCNKSILSNYNNTNRLVNTFGIWGVNVRGVNGNRYMSNYFYTLDVWGTKRTSGSSIASLRLKGDVSDTRLPLAISPDLLRGAEIVPNVSSGVIKVYVAFKNMTNPEYIYKRLSVTVEGKIINELGDNNYNTFTSKLNGRIEDDSSTWSEPGLTTKAILVPFETDFPLEPLSIRMFYDWYDVNGYTYIDPQIEVV